MTAATTHLPKEARYCADTFNGAVAAAALSAAWDIGLLDELADRDAVDVPEFTARTRTHPEAVRRILVALSSRRIVVVDAGPNLARRGPGFDEAFRTRGFFYWLTRGCGELFTDLTTLVRTDERADRQMRRDSRAISVACRSIARNFFDPPLRDLLDGIDYTTVADLGCGSGDRIIMLAERQPAIRAIGVDIAPGALTVAGEAVRDANLTDRITLLRDDVLNMSPRPEYADAELVTCFLMGHDFWPRDNCVKTLQKLRETFPNGRNLLLGDTCRSVGVEGPDLPMFTLGFETVHAIMDQYLPTLDEWYSVIDESGWRLADQRLIELPAFSFIFHLTPA
ncbi:MULTISPECIES: class I SAM-dependent methyltransferase [Actinomadura]|uniref:Methyltransferase domain-containing protein n=1 Tax=Actinomadura rudentiformis TaxID=359158 RepID=A0A6H9YEQ3_9ACTN|nr:class I SAM-dependent methyltransferase [Actinomadura rudentiformis]KAB2343771.1 methyltransferase domain-containing protein [Actinomadura rudentiformis]